MVRVATGVPALAAVLSLIAFAPRQVVGAVILLCAVFGMVEFHRLSRKITTHPPGLPELVVGAGLITGGGLVAGPAGLNAMLAVALLLMILRGFTRGAPADAMHTVVQGVFGLIWIPWSFGHLVLLLPRPDGSRLVFLLLVVVVANDSLAYFVGTLLGRHKLLPGISPAKTIEGSLGGIVGGLLGGWMAIAWFQPPHLGWDMVSMLVLSALLAIVAQAGDLVESMVKRVAGVKDSGRFLPGHGGFLDRLDAFLLTPPIMYYYLYWF